MKTAKLHITVVEFSCPTCGENISSECGSHMFALNEPLPEILVCDCCGDRLKVPAKAMKLKVAR